MERIEKSFGENQVLIDVNFVVNAGETHALLGENGAGKSTLMKVLIGVYMADSGRIVLDGEDVTALSLRERLDRGIAMIFQELSVLPNRSVAENLFVLREPRAFGWRVDTQRMIADAQSLIDRYGFGLRASARVGDLGFRATPDGGDPEGALARREAPRHGRTNLVSDSARGRNVVRDGGPAQSLRHRHRLHQPSHGGRAAALRPHLDRQGRASDRAAHAERDVHRAHRVADVTVAGKSKQIDAR